MALEWFTYAVLGERLGISPEAVRQRAIRHEWTKRTGNDGKAEIRVDADELVAAQPPKSQAEHPSDEGPTIDPTPVEQPADARTIAALDAHIASLQAMVERAHSQADHERERAADERARADRERDRAEGIAAELARVRTESMTGVASVEQDVATLRRVVEAMKEPADAARAREIALEARIEAVRAEAATLRDRSWWRRLAG